MQYIYLSSLATKHNLLIVVRYRDNGMLTVEFLVDQVGSWWHARSSVIHESHFNQWIVDSFFLAYEN